MRMAGPDIVLFVFGALLFGGATYAIVSAPGGAGAGGQTSALGVFNVEYALTTVEIGEAGVAMRDGTAEFEVNASNVVTVLVTVACNDQAPGPAAFQVQVQVTGPNGLTGKGSGACGQGVEVEVAAGDVPAATSVRGNNEEEARENLEVSASNATGTWSVTVSGARTGGLPGLPVGDPDGTIAFALETAEPRFAPVQR